MPRWSLLLFVIVFAAVAALVAAERRGDPEPEPRAQARSLADHLRALQRIADEHGATRAAGSPGDAATANYIEQRLRDAGYRVTRQTFRVPYYRESARPRLISGGRRVRPVRALQFSPPGPRGGLDDCYHQRCDTLRNVDLEVLAESASATEGALLDLSR